MKKHFKINATLSKDGKYYEHFGIHPTLCSMYGRKISDIVELDLIISSDQSKSVDKSIDYWGWYDNEKDEFTLIYAAYFLLDMCFAYGIKASENANRGKAYRLNIIN